jgi:hypothetical protein
MDNAFRLLELSVYRKGFDDPYVIYLRRSTKETIQMIDNDLQKNGFGEDIWSMSIRDADGVYHNFRVGFVVSYRLEDLNYDR